MLNRIFFVGIDVGTSYVKSVVLNSNKEIVSSFVKRTGTSIKDSIKAVFENAISSISLSKTSIKHITATGYGKSKVSFADTHKTEISCHAKGAYHYFPKKITIIDIGGQDTKVIKLDENGKIVRFKMNRKCAAGTGAFIEEIAYRLDLPLNELNTLATKSTSNVPLASFCTVFAKTEILTRIKEGEKVEDLIKSAFGSVIRRIIEMTELEGTIVLTGGLIAYNSIIGEILKSEIDADILTPPHPQLTGAIGAALFAFESGNLKES
ncbi:MAG: ATPase [Candidatus Lokiarchaeota archaeon]|nr:ATPase [Candidatus Lokiarchaeota archaeon]